MATTATLTAAPRTGTGKGVARKLRSAGQVPGVIYGHAREPQPIQIAQRELDRLLERIVAASTVIELQLDGQTARTLIREIQRHPVKRNVIHVDFQELVAGETVTVRIPIIFHGTAEGVRAGGVLDQVMHEIEIDADPANIPEHVDVDVTTLALGHSLHVGDLKLPEGVTILDDPEATICVISTPRAAMETPAEGVPAVEGAVEPELIRKPKEEEGEE